MTLFDGAAFALRFVVAALAVLLARRRAEHRPAAVFLVALAIIDPIRFALNAGPLNAPRPYTGALRALFHLDQLGFISWPCGIAALANVVFRRRRAWPIALVTALVWATLVVGYPYPFRGERLGQAYAAIAAASILWTVVCAAIWTSRRDHPRPWHACVTLLGLLNVPLFFGPYLPSASPFETWDAAQVIFFVLWIALLAVHGGALWSNFMLLPSPRDSLLRRH